MTINEPQGQIIITGAAGGMGEATSQLLAQKGYDVIAIDHNVKRLQNLQGLNPAIKIIALDLNDAQLITTVQQVLNENIPVVGLINMVGISKGNTIDRLSDDDWNESFAINVTPAMKLIRLLAPKMQQQKHGSIVNVGSPVGIIGARKPSYAASKAALHGLTMSCARNLGGDNVRVNLLLPGPTITYMTEDWDTERCQGVANGTFLKRLCTPKEIANVIDFLMSDESTYITGSVVDMTAGSMYGH
jgi:NAD(P)-dependent dehydrogenase (short-subunit alcohol dehydrogenase family)